jgi:hypothetical protein
MQQSYPNEKLYELHFFIIQVVQSLHSPHLWHSCRRYDSTDGGGRSRREQAIEGNATQGRSRDRAIAEAKLTARPTWLHLILKSSRLYRLSGLYRPNPVRPHHLVVLMLDDMAVPNELSRRIETRFDTRNLPRIGNDGILSTCFP